MLSKIITSTRMIRVIASRISTRSVALVGFRPISFSSKEKSEHNISDELSNENLPKGTGSGPFIELPSFKPLGNPSDLLNITMPQSSRLNIRNGTIIGMNGDLKSLSSTPQILAKTEYQELLSQSSVSLLINGGVNNYSIIKISNVDEKWTVLKDENIIAWTGLDLQLRPEGIVDKFRSIQSNGKGIIVINGEEQLFEIELESNEEFIINPNSLVAYNTSLGFTVLNNSWIQSFKITNKFKIPSIVRSYVSNIKNYFNLQYNKLIATLDINDQIKIIRKYRDSLMSFVMFNIINKIWNKPIYFKVIGPGRLLIDNNIHQSNSRNFSKREVNDILNRR